ncbi:MAG: acyl carrier protein [Magnetococcales bacterium]|nr:acyl carrier protein [Magnetococcales bacterium]
MSSPDVYRLVAEALECAPQTLTQDSGLGSHPQWDSFGHLRVMLVLEQHLGIEINDATILQFETMQSILAYCSALPAAQQEKITPMS